MTHTKFRIIVVSAVFIAILSFAFFNNIFNVIKDIKSSENRQMTSKPVMYLQHLDPYPTQYEKYYNDNFSIRSKLIRYYNIINLKFYQKSPFPEQVIIGNDKWLYYAGNELDSYQGKHRFSDSELNEMKLEFEYRKKYLEKRGIKYYIVFAPAKANIYSEHIPLSYYRQNDQSWGEQIIEYLNKNSSIKPINLYPVLRQLKDKESLYYKYDNHWNQQGAFYATNEILKRIHTDFQNINPLQRETFNIKTTERDGGNLTDILSGTLNFKDSEFKLIPKKGFKSKEIEKFGYPVVPGFPYIGEYETDREIKGSKQPRILLISDSFGGAVFPFLSEEFSRSVRIFDAWQYKLNEEIIENEKPDVVVLLALESNIRNMFLYESRLKGQK